MTMSISDPKSASKAINCPRKYKSTKKVVCYDEIMKIFSAMSDINSLLFSTPNRPIQDGKRGLDMDALSQNFNDIYDE